ncbi:MAG: outer membrane lipoprotein carrier protein LolA [Bacteroidales bacterium]|nr:outer membrane lipoprotein carrier protein LolA [Bacteroidales bacterium]MCB9029347.1 outer membrane lipoprotein carrier protein LolA [Bacteroidales bacterium]
MKKTGLTILLALMVTGVSAQKDPEAVKVLTEFGNKATLAPSVKIDFEITAYDAQEDDETTMEGTAVIRGDSYRVTLPDNIIMADGKAVWNFMPDVNEVTVTEPDPADESFLSRPSLLFTMYREGYKIRLLEQTPRDWTIDLYPEDLNMNLVRIRMIIDKKNHDLISAEYRTKDGITLTLTALKYDLSFSPPAGYFTFNRADHQGVEVIDMR